MELFITDLDGTLLNKNAEVSEYSRKTIGKLIDSGMNFTAATARTLASAGKILDGIGLRLPVILMNGVLIYDPFLRKYEVVNKLNDCAKASVIQMMRSMKLSAFMYTISHGEMLTYFEKLSNKAMEDFYNERREKYYKSFEQTEDFSKVCADVIYFTFVDKKEKLAPLYESLKDDSSLSLTYYNDVYTEGIWYLEVFSAKASKKNGVRYLRDKYGFDRITAFGDNTNDLPMFEEADVKIAVSNANPAIIQQCDLMIDSNENDGVAKYLEGIFNG